MKGYGHKKPVESRDFDLKINTYSNTYAKRNLDLTAMPCQQIVKEMTVKKANAEQIL